MSALDAAPLDAVNVPPLSDGELSASASLDGGAVKVLFSGTADMRVNEMLSGFLSAVHGEALRLGVREVSISFRDLEFMNSSCFKSFVVWISEVRELPQEKQYAIRFLSQPGMLWQRRSLHALRCFAVDLISIDE